MNTKKWISGGLTGICAFSALIFCSEAYAYTTEYYLDEFIFDDGTQNTVSFVKGSNDFSSNFQNESGTTGNSDMDTAPGPWTAIQPDILYLKEQNSAPADGNKPAKVEISYTPGNFGNESGSLEVWFGPPQETLAVNDSIEISLTGIGDPSKRIELVYENDGTGQFEMRFTIANGGPPTLIASDTLSPLSTALGLRFNIDTTDDSVVAAYSLDYNGGSPIWHLSNGDWSSTGTGTVPSYDTVSYSAGAAVTFNPEPSTLIMMIIGILGGALKIKNNLLGRF